MRAVLRPCDPSPGAAASVEQGVDLGEGGGLVGEGEAAVLDDLAGGAGRVLHRSFAAGGLSMAAYAFGG